MDPRKITRTFLLKGPLPDVRGLPSSTMKKGCLSSGRGREVWVEQNDRSYAIRVQDQQANTISLVNISQKEFAPLWELCGKARVELVRYLANADFELDVFGGGLEPFALARVHFDSSLGNRRFKKPDFLGREITDSELYSLRMIALRGLPVNPVPQMQAGAVPFLFKNGILHIVLVTSSSGSRWLIPKGRLETGMTLQEVALMEAAEEAGVIGIIESGVEAQCRMEDQRTIHLYPLRVATLLPLWPEKLSRRRIVLPIYHALLRITDVELCRAIRSLSRELLP